MARPHIDYSRAFEDAVKRFKILVTYFDVTRPQYDKAFKDKNGRFSKDVLKWKMNYLTNWNPRGRHSPEQYRMYARYSKEFNDTFGIESRLVEKMVGYYRDENGRKCRISIDKIVDRLTSEGWLKKVLNAGAKFRRTDKGFEKKFRWKKKYIMSDSAWNGMIDKSEWSDYTTYPNVKFDANVQRAVSIISKWRRDEQAKIILYDFRKHKDFNRTLSQLKKIGREDLVERILTTTQQQKERSEDERHID